MSLKINANCSICGTEFKCDPRYFNDPKCFQCLKNNTKISKKVLSSVIKNVGQGFTVRAEITTDGAIMNALMANANAFRAIGGSPMMFTEHVENGIDAIKALHGWKSTDSPKKLGDIKIIFVVSPENIIGGPMLFDKRCFKQKRLNFGISLQAINFFYFLEKSKWISLK